MNIARVGTVITVLIIVVVIVFSTRSSAVRTRSARLRRANVPVPLGAHFRLDHVSRHRYVLHNDGTAAAYEVRLETGELVVHEGALAFDDFQPTQTEEYLLIQPLQGRLSEITVRWKDRPGGPDRSGHLALDTTITSTEDQGA